ncbi:flagellar export chaperone FlgN [Aeromonas sp. A-5]|uniref:flagellar export chaperone FlgN n=1 Tax=Aeromonas ichthyocola TaxID=3367746 RepID=UPI0038DC5E56
MMDLPSLLHTQDDYLSQMQGILEEEFSLLEAASGTGPARTDRAQTAVACCDRNPGQDLAEMPELALQLAAYPDEMAQLRAKLDACQAQNDINGRLLELSIVSNRRLATFLSQLRDRNSLTYDAKGNTRSGTRSYGIKA